MGIVMMAAPVFMLQLSANVNIQFDDYESITSHPMAAPFLASFSQLFEGTFGDKEEMTAKIEVPEEKNDDTPA